MVLWGRLGGFFGGLSGRLGSLLGASCAVLEPLGGLLGRPGGLLRGSWGAIYMGQARRSGGI